MNRTIAAIILGLGVSGTAFAADRSKDETQVVPSREALPANPISKISMRTRKDSTIAIVTRA